MSDQERAARLRVGAKPEANVPARKGLGGRSRPQLKAWCNLCGVYKTCDRNNWRILFKDADERWKIPGEKGCWEVTAERSPKYPPSTSTSTSNQEELCCSACFQSDTDFREHKRQARARDSDNIIEPEEGHATRHVRARFHEQQEELHQVKQLLQQKEQAAADALQEVQWCMLQVGDIQKKLQAAQKKRNVYQTECKAMRDRISDLFGVRSVFTWVHYPID